MRPKPLKERVADIHLQTFYPTSYALTALSALCLALLAVTSARAPERNLPLTYACAALISVSALHLLSPFAAAYLGARRTRPASNGAGCAGPERAPTRRP